ncbi:MAG: hypothetical protein NZM11_10520 [Anaerolineales bacterium]|nr:hypothetical protein [Anaerolineales bacterium]
MAISLKYESSQPIEDSYFQPRERIAENHPTHEVTEAKRVVAAEPEIGNGIVFGQLLISQLLDFGEWELLVLDMAACCFA